LSIEDAREERKEQGQQPTELDEDKLMERIEKLREQIMTIKDQRRQLIEEVRNLRAQRRQLIEERSKLIARMKELKEERSKLMEELNKLRTERDQLREQLNTKREQLKVARAIAEKEGGLAKISLRKLQRRLEELEWKQMTTVMPPYEEQRIIDEISRLEELIDRVRRAKQQYLSVMELEAEVRALRLRLSDVISRMNEIREKIGVIKNEMQELALKIDEYNKKINALNSKINEHSSIIDDLTKQLDEVYSEYREAMIKLKEIKIAKRHRITVEMLEQKRKEVIEKYKRGEPLSLEELKILYGEFDELL